MRRPKDQVHVEIRPRTIMFKPGFSLEMWRLVGDFRHHITLERSQFATYEKAKEYADERIAELRAEKEERRELEQQTTRYEVTI